MPRVFLSFFFIYKHGKKYLIVLEVYIVKHGVKGYLDRRAFGFFFFLLLWWLGVVLSFNK
jgi:hypothetical protein